MSTILDERPDTKNVFEDDPNEMAHIVYPKEKVTEAYVLGNPVTALCGFTWVPSKDPQNKPVCQKCLDIWKQMGREEGNWST